MKKIVSLTIALALAVGLGAFGLASQANAKDKPIRITLVTMDQMDVHWVKLQKAAKAKVDALKKAGKNIEYEWLAPERKENAQQIEKIEAATNDGSDVIIVAPNDATALNDTLKAALDKGIKLVYIDTPATLAPSAFYGTDNYAGGAKAGQALRELLEKNGLTEGTVGIVSAQAGVQSCIDRVDGFKSAFEGSKFVMGETQYSDADAVKAQEMSNALIQDGVIALYSAQENATVGVGNAVKEANDSGKTIYAVGFDNSSSTRALVREGVILGFIAQNPQIMGEKSIEAAVTLAEGGTIADTKVDTGSTLVTKENVDQFED